GLLPYSPVLFLAVIGFPILLAELRRIEADEPQAHERIDPPPLRPTARRELWAALAIIAYYLIFVSSYTWWQGGSSFGSRHLLQMMPFLALPLGFIADLRPKLTFSLLILSLSVMTVVTA